MLCFDRVLVAPGRAELERTLTEAAVAANKGRRARLLHWTSADTDALLLDCAASSEGFRQWNGEGQAKTRAYQDTLSAVAVVWWTDRLKRLHYRIAAERICCGSSDTTNFLCPYKKRPPLWLVYPENMYFRERKGKEVSRPFAICRCGMTGEPEALGWMGPCCAACHDRAEAGEAAPVLPGEPARRMFGPVARRAGTVVFSADGRHLVSSQRSGEEAVVWDLETGEARKIRGSGQDSALAVSANGAIAVVSSEGSILLHSLTHPGEPVRTLPVKGREIQDLAFSPDGSLLAVAPYGKAELWDVTAGRRVAVIASGLAVLGSSRYFAFSPDGKVLAVAEGLDGLHLWDVAAGRSEVLKLPGITYPEAVAFSANGCTLAVINSTPSKAFLVDLPTRRVISLKKSDDGANDAAFSPDGRLLALGGHPGSVRLYDVAEGQRLGSFVWHTETVNSVAFSPDGRWLASASDDGFVKLWPVAVLRSAPE
jgi:sugar lactone lactonase YvrE